jgi:hypothetical protein
MTGRPETASATLVLTSQDRLDGQDCTSCFSLARLRRGEADSALPASFCPLSSTWEADLKLHHVASLTLASADMQGGQLSRPETREWGRGQVVPSK